MGIEKFQALLAKLKALPEIKIAEPNIFAIGSRGYYENPTTDILAYFCDTQGSHGLGSLVLEALIECLPAEAFDSSNDAKLITPPEREVRTPLGKRIDLLLNGADWVILLENKIYHQQNNPFTEYEAHAEKYYNTKQKLYIVLSPNGTSVKSNWYGISYQSLLISMKNKLSEHFLSQPFNKWILLLREFILHMESFMVQPTLENENINFVFDNIVDIVAIEKLKNSAVNEFQQKVQRALSQYFDCGVGIRLHNWSGYPAMRFYLERWQSDSDVVLYHNDNTNSKFSINFYFRARNPEHFAQIDSIVPDFDSIEHWEESNNKYRGFQFHLEDMPFEQIVEAIVNRLKQIDEYETSLA